MTSCRRGKGGTDGAADFGDLNYLAVLVGAVAYWLVGAVWYSPVLFGKKWGAITGITADNSGSYAVTYGLSLVLMFVQVVAVSFLAHAVSASDFVDGLQLGLGVSVAFCAGQLLINQIYDKRSMPLFWINAGYAIVGLTVASIIVTLWD